MSTTNVERVLFERPQSLVALPFPYCPGCSHGIINRLVAEVVDSLGISERVVGVTSIGCSVRCWKHFTYDMVQAAHGRAPAVATGLRRVMPDRIIFTYQGDGDLAAIGTAEALHSAARGERITIFFVNNAIYGATGGQMAPTTLLGQKTSSSPYGRDPVAAGFPIRVAELLATLPAPGYIARVGVFDAANVNRARRAVQRAFEVQMEGKGFSLVEFLASCPTNLKMDPVKANEWVQKELQQYFPLGQFKSPEE
ncbi:MAG: thiamine pyrophosphate-dependent enzyme [Chloroflexi bacterium]|nr:thiamine pyrophosphate-dependent enzyme [Chloroflexota bacterium]